MNFARVEIDGKLYQSKLFGIAIYDRHDNSNSKFGFIISTKISKKAVTRNKIKRLISEAIRTHLDNIRDGLDVVFLLKPLVTKVSDEEIKNEANETIIKNLQK